MPRRLALFPAFGESARPDLPLVPRMSQPSRVSDPERDDATTAARRARSLRYMRIGLVALVAVLLVVAWRLGLFSLFADPARLKQTLLDLGPWGYVAFVVAYAVLQPFGVPGTVFVMAAPLIWPWPVAFALSMTGTMAASCVGFSFTRFVGREWVASMVPARFKKYDDALEKRGFVTVALLRFIFWMPPPLHIFFGLSKVSFWTHFWGSLVGYAVPLFVTSYFGEKAFDWMRSLPVEAWVGTGVGLVVLAAGWWLVSRRLRRGRAANPAGLG